MQFVQLIASKLRGFLGHGVARDRRKVLPNLLIVAASIWVFTNAYFFDNYISVLEWHKGRLVILFGLTLLAWFAVASFYASFHLTSFLFSLVAQRSKGVIDRKYGTTPLVAILYTCMNDAKTKAIESCLAQDYPNCLMYILDDSTVKAERDSIDDIRNTYGDRITVLRRRDRAGFKAGNLNHALRKALSEVDYFCVVDSDEILPANFVRETVAIAESDKTIGFVQVGHRTYGDTCFGTQTGGDVDLHWNYYLPARNRFGFVYFYGHGALLRTAAVLEAGGVPEVVCEDLALATRLREIGYRGYFVHEMWCLEETPPTYAAFRRRNGKVVSGTLEFLFKIYPSFFRCKRVSLTEKIDVLVGATVIFLPITFIAFIFVFHLLAPFLLLGVPNSVLGAVRSAQEVTSTFNSFHGWDFCAFVLVTVLAPACYLIPSFLRRPIATSFCFARMCTIHLSVSVQTAYEAAKFVLTQRASFVPTGDRTHTPSHDLAVWLDCTIGVLLVGLSLVWTSLSLAAIGLSLALVPTLVRRNLDGWLRAMLVLLPLAFAITGIISAPMLALGAAGGLVGAILAHH